MNEKGVPAEETAEAKTGKEVWTTNKERARWEENHKKHPENPLGG